MSHPVEVQFQGVDLDQIAQLTGKISLICDGDKPATAAARALNRLTKGAVARAMASAAMAE